MVKQAIREVVVRGTTVIAAAGNTNFFPSPRKNRTDYPAGWATGTTGFMSIGALDQKLAYADFATASSTVEMVAPGADTQLGTTLPNSTGIETYDADGTPMVFMEGTSFSAPFVVGVAANLYAQCPNLSTNSYLNPKWLELNLMSTATPWTPKSQIRRTLPWPLANRFVPGLLNVANSLSTPCP
jgi:subtilisin family serine protease